MPNLDLTITDIMHGDTPVLKIMKGDVHKWPFLPYDAEVEWLETDGNAYITLGSSYPVTSSSTTIWKGEIGYKQGSSGRRFLACYANEAKIHYSEITVQNKFGNGTNYGIVAIESEKLYNVELIINASSAIQKIEYNGNILEQTITTYQGTDAFQFYLFRLNSSYKGIGQRIGKNSFTYNGDKKFDFIPVRKDGVGYLYDKVSRTLFGNAGTGSFTYGNDKT